MNFLLGADPEVIIAKDGTPVSAVGLLEVGRYNPLEVEDMSFHEDNVLLEFNISPAANAGEFVENNQKALDYISQEILGPKGFEIYPKCEGKYTHEEILHPQAQEIGCLPEYNAYTKGLHHHSDFGLKQLRTAGGHVHIGYEGETKAKSIQLIQILDLHLGLPSLLMEEPNQRRKMYGQAGAYRRTAKLKVEYRTLSNVWLWSADAMNWVYETVATAVELLGDNYKVPKSLQATLIDVINNHKVDEAQEICNEYNISLVEKKEYVTT